MRGSCAAAAAANRQPAPDGPTCEVPAPWRLLSPSCVVYTVRDEQALIELACELSVKPSIFKQLVGLQANSSPGLPQHKSGWQLVERAWWIARCEWHTLAAIAPLPFAGADGAQWVEAFACIHCDAELNGARLRTLAHKARAPSQSTRRALIPTAAGARWCRAQLISRTCRTYNCHHHMRHRWVRELCVCCML